MDLSNLQDKDVTVFGGTGFIGRAVVQRLAHAGARIRVPTRCLSSALPLKTAGNVGQIVPLSIDLHNDADLKACVSGCHGVVYLPGLLTERTGTFLDVHADTPGRLASICAEESVRAFVFMSALGAREESPSAYAKTKAMGEARVTKAFPSATVMRPSVVFGPRDDFFNRFKRMAISSPFLPLVGGGEGRMQPVYVGNVADAISLSLSNSSHHGKIYHLGGPDVVTMREIMELVCKYSGHKRKLLSLPWSVALMMANVAEAIPFLPAPITADQIAMLQEDNVVPPRVLTLKNLGVSPSSIEANLPKYMGTWHTHDRYRAFNAVEN